MTNKKPYDVYVIFKTDTRYPSNYYNQSSEILPLEDFGNKTIVFDDMLGSMEAKEIDAFLLLGVTKILIYITSLNHDKRYLKTLFEIFVVGICCFHKQ